MLACAYGVRPNPVDDRHGVPKDGIPMATFLLSIEDTERPVNGVRLRIENFLVVAQVVARPSRERRAQAAPTSLAGGVCLGKIALLPDSSGLNAGGSSSKGLFSERRYVSPSTLCDTRRRNRADLVPCSGHVCPYRTWA